MDVHFISTGPFNYLHMIAIRTACVTQPVEHINLWYTVKPSGVYFDQIASQVVLKEVDLTELVVRGVKQPINAAHIKDYVMWEILDSIGGIVLDLDTICIKDLTNLLDGELMTASLDVEDPNSIPFPFNSAVVIAEPGTRLTRACKRFTNAMICHENLPWGLTGPIILSTIANDNLARGFKVTPHLVLNPFGGNEISAIYREDPTELVTLPEETLIVHLYAKASPGFDTINAEWVRTSTSLLARLIKQSLSIRGWNVRAPWDEDAYLKARGIHYKGLFDVIKDITPTSIFEIGTSFGQTAIGMIRVAGQFAKEEEIAYFGVDLFESGQPSQWESEFTGGYVPLSLRDVRERLTSETEAIITLFIMDSKALHDLPMEYRTQMDLIFIDGGHSLETVASDWKFAQTLFHEDTVVVFDDYFPELPFIGAKQVVDGIDRAVYDVQIRPEIDDYTHSFGRLRTQLVIVKLRKPKPERVVAKPWAKDILVKVLPTPIKGA